MKPYTKLYCQYYHQNEVDGPESELVADNYCPVDKNQVETYRLHDVGVPHPQCAILAQRQKLLRNAMGFIRAGDEKISHRGWTNIVRGGPWSECTFVRE